MRSSLGEFLLESNGIASLLVHCIPYRPHLLSELA